MVLLTVLTKFKIYKINLTNPAKILQSPGPVSKMIKMTQSLKMKRSTAIKQKKKNR